MDEESKKFSNSKISTSENCSAFAELFHDGGHHHIETSSLICYANQWTGVYMIETSVIKELICCQFRPGVAYKSVAFKKCVCY